MATMVYGGVVGSALLAVTLSGACGDTPGNPAGDSGPPVDGEGARDSADPVDASPADAGPPPRWVGYLADQETNGISELFIADLDGNVPSMRVNETLAAGTSLGAGSWTWTVDGEAILYHAVHEGHDDAELFRVAIGPSGPGIAERVNAPLEEVSDHVLGNYGRDAGFRESPDGRRIMYIGNHQPGSTDQMYVVDTGLPGVAQRVSAPLADGQSVYTEDWTPWSPDSSRLLYHGAQTTGRYELFVSDVAGAIPETPYRVNPIPVAGGDVRPAWRGVGFWSPDSAWILYLGDLTTDEVEELWVTRLIDGVPGPTLKVNGALVTGGDVFVGYDATFWSPDGTRILYVADQEVNDQKELYVVDMTGATPGPAYKVNGALPSGRSVLINEFLGGHYYGWSPNSRWVSYLARPDDPTVTQLFVVDVSGSTPGPAQAVGGPFTESETGVGTDYQWSPDGTRIAYQSRTVSNSPIHDFFVVDVGNGTPAPPQRVCDVSIQVRSMRWSPDGSRLAFAGEVAGGKPELYVVDAANLGTPTLMSGSMVAGGEVSWSFRWSADSQQLIFHADREALFISELWIVDVSGAAEGMPRRLSGEMALNGDVTVDQYEVAP